MRFPGIPVVGQVEKSRIDWAGDFSSHPNIGALTIFSKDI
jgi:hypothetical protein